MPDTTKIHFTDGQSLVVEQAPRAVAETLGKGATFVKFTKRNTGRAVYIASNQVTHIEQLPAERSAAGAGKGPAAVTGLTRPKAGLRGKTFGRA
jgi:hypothetical protein